MTRADILAQAYTELNYGSTPPTAVSTRFGYWLNEGLRKVLGTPGLTGLRTSDSQFALTAVASQARYVVPESVERIRSIQNRTNDYTLALMTLEQYRRIEPDPTAMTGTPTHYVPIGRVAVSVQPSNASALFVDSTAAGDTGTAYVEGIVTGGYQRTASVTMTGVTAVNISTTISTWIEVTDFYISTAAVGTVTLVEDASGGTELAQITIGQTRPRYFGFYLWPTPAAADSYVIEYDRRVVELTNAGDEPPWGENYHYVLVDYLRMREYEKTAGDSNANLARYQRAKSTFEEGLQALKQFIWNPPDYRPAIGGSRAIRRSRFGAWYPSDSY